MTFRFSGLTAVRRVLNSAALSTIRVRAAVASCVASAYGDRGFNWAYVMLLALPFGVLVAIAGVLAWSAGYRPGQLRTLVRTRIIEERT
jgi:hypothetical protein